MLRISKDVMEDQRLLASAALFRELHENNKDVYDVLAQFIRSSITADSLWTFNIAQCQRSLDLNFGFDIPDAVIRRCLKIRVIRDGEAKLERGIYSVTEKFNRDFLLNSEYKDVQSEHDSIIKSLISYSESLFQETLDEMAKEVLIKDFNNYFLNGERKSRNAICISQFIVKNSENPNFLEKLNRVEEGILLYMGICYSSDLINHEPWRKNFTFFLDTEILFWAQGFNGELHKKFFNDFYGLVKDLDKGAGRDVNIEFRYFSETENEVNDFFYAAERIVERRQLPDPSKDAMGSIVNGCNSKSDVVTKKVAFYQFLDSLKISRESSLNYYADNEFNIESSQTLTDLGLKYPETDEVKIAYVLKLFSKINFIRRGANNVGLEQAGAIFVSGKNLARSMAFDELISQGKGATPFATDINYITERAWLKLNRGFSKNNATPKSFDVVARAQIVLATQAGNKVGQEYRKLKEQISKGVISKEVAGALISELRSRSIKPEDIVPDTIDENFIFISNDFIENAVNKIGLLEEKAALAERAEEENSALQKQLKNQKLNSEKEFIHHRCKLRKERFHSHRKLADGRYNRLVILISILLIELSLVLFYYLTKSGDTPLAIISAFLAFSPVVLAYKKRKYISYFLKNLVVAGYKNKIADLSLIKSK